MKLSVTALLIGATFALTIGESQAAAEQSRIDAATRAIEPKIVAWRRDIHANPELGNREFRTAKLVAEHLKKLGLEVRTGIAHTGVTAVLKGGRPGPTVALRADMDGLPVTEKVDVPFKSRVTTEYRGEKVGVMHACGHDVHVAVLMGVAEALTGMRASLPGTVLFIFQPAEEGAPEGEEGGAELMLKEGLFASVKPQAVFGLHMWSLMNVGQIGLRRGPAMAAVDSFKVEVIGRQAHGSRPWQSVDPIVASAQIITALQTVVSRQVDLTANPAVVTVGAIKGGIRQNIIPERVEFIGTIRTFTEEQRSRVFAGLKLITEKTAEASGAKATFTVQPPSFPVTYNDPGLAERMLPSLQRVAGAQNIVNMDLITGAEDFSFYQKQVPGLFFFVGSTPAGQDAFKAPSNHSDYFFVDEASIPIATRALLQVAVDFLEGTGNR
jgi:amidohydrolase